MFVNPTNDKQERISSLGNPEIISGVAQHNSYFKLCQRSRKASFIEFWKGQESKVLSIGKRLC